MDELRRAVRERAERGAAVVKIMASGGVMTPGTDMLAGQFSVGQLRAVVEEAHRLGLPVTAHAHALPAVERSAAAGVDGIEHCSCLTADRVAPAAGAAGPARRDRHLRLPDPRARARASSRRPGCRRRSRPRMGPTSSTSRTSRSSAAPALVLVAGTDAGIGPSKRHGLVPMGVADLVDACGMAPTEALAAATGVAARRLRPATAARGGWRPGWTPTCSMVDGDR